MDHPSVPYHNPKANVHSILEVMVFPGVTHFIVDCCCCNEDQLKTLDFSNWKSIQEIEIGSHSFRNVKGVDIIGLSQLERVVIGKNCFSQVYYLPGIISPQFTVKNCERLKELKIGCQSFCFFDICEITSNASLEVIEMGKMNEVGASFVSGGLRISRMFFSSE